MQTLKIASTAGRPMLVSPAAKRFMKPPALKLLPRRARTKGLLLSTALHTVLIAGLIWLPALFPSPVIVSMDRPEAAVDYAPLVMPELPPLTSSGSGSMESEARTPRASSADEPNAANRLPPKRDYIAPQEIVSDFPNAVNRVQTIRRPDLVSPPDLKFPLRLQSMIILPAPAAPVLKVPLREEPKEPQPTPLAANAVELPIPVATVAIPKLKSTLKRVAADSSEPAVPKTAVPQPSATNLNVLAEPHLNPPKAAVVVNAVSLPSDPAAQIPDAQLAGSFVVGPSLDTTIAEKSTVGGTGRSAEDGPSRRDEGLLQSHKGSGAGADAGTGTEAGPGSGAASSATSGNRASAGSGTGLAATAGPGSGSGVPGRSTGNGGASGISISGGTSGRTGATTGRTPPPNRSYGLTIISGGSSGGASRDVGVFDRSETVFSVVIPMADVGGGPDWPMQYALLHRTQAGPGLLVPPFAQKKVAATMSKSQLIEESGPVFVSGTIDENGKLQSLRTVRTQDARSQSAIRALQQWEFLPAQLDGRPVASKVLIGVTVVVAE
jgi:Gram-negative bacterial TonB protein C-terminal